LCEILTGRITGIIKGGVSTTKQGEFRMSQNDSGASFLTLFFSIAIILAASCRGCAVDPQRAVDAVEAVGFTDVSIINHGWMFTGFRGCGSDAAIVRVSGTNPVGNKVELDVCLGWPFKGATIRGN
jgi:hypothetical protein